MYAQICMFSCIVMHIFTYFDLFIYISMKNLWKVLQNFASLVSDLIGRL